jgi:chemosensory pili system protein ChpA (sensor histidine kinase/response regulator)
MLQKKSSSKSTAKRRNAPPKRTTAGNPLIMVVEDDDDNRLMMKTLLEMKGYRVAEASNGEEAITLAQRRRPDLILMDLQLPRLNGFAVTRFFRLDHGLRDVPIILVSGHDPARHLKLALAAGCNHYLLKPIDFRRLETLLDDLLGTARDASRQASQEAFASQEANV